MASLQTVSLTCILPVLLMIYTGCLGTPSVTRQFTPDKSEIKGDNSTFKIVCYFGLGDRSPYPGVLPPALNISLCTHVLFIGTPIVDAGIAPGNPKDIDLYFSKVPLIKKMKPSLKVLVTNGGNYSQVMRKPENRTKYAHSALSFVRKYGFDGLDMDWEFPEFSDFFHLPEHRHNFSLVVKEIRELFDEDTRQHGGDRLLLTMAVSAGTDMIQWYYDVPELAKYVDFVSVMSYDRHMYLKDFPLTGHNSPLYRGNHILDETVFRETYFVYSTNEWVRRGMNKTKVMAGIPTYAHTYNLFSQEWNDVYSLATGLGSIGDYPTFSTICELRRNSSTTVVWDDVSKVPYLYQGPLWISYDDIKSVTLKTEYLLHAGFSGAMVYVLNSDDYEGKCDGKTKWPLFTAINDAVKNFKSRQNKPSEISFSYEEIEFLDIE